MPRIAGIVSALLLAGRGIAVEQQSEASHALNPIRKVVTLLQSMQTKVEEEGKREKALYDKYVCHCKTSGADLTGSISAAEEKVPVVSSSIEATAGRLKQAKADLKNAQVDRSAAKDAMAEATALRKKEASAFAKYKADADTNIAALVKAVAALEKGMGGSFLQTDAAQVLRRIADSEVDMLDADRQTLVAFLAHSTDYAPQSGEITGILKQMTDTMSADLAEATATEKAAIQSYEELMAAKSKQVAALTGKVEAKTQQIGELGLTLVEMKEDLSDTQAALAEDQKYIADLQTSCAKIEAEWQDRSETRAAELVALADTIKVLNDDDALELFKQTLPSASASFLQVRERTAERRASALVAVREARDKAVHQDLPGLELLALELAGKSKSAGQGGFDKVIKMIDSMVEVLKKEQQDDEHKKEFCEKQFDLSDDNKKQLERTISDEAAAIATAEESIETLTREIAALEAGIKALDRAVAEATSQRQAENAEFKSLMASNSASKQLLVYAKNRLNKFYNPKLYKPAPKVEMASREDRIFSSMGGTVTTAAPGGIADTGITVLAQVSVHSGMSKAAPPPPPETWNAYAKKGEENSGVIAMINLLITDLDKEMTAAATEEKDAQAEYEQMMQDSAEKRTTDSKSLTNKGGAKADVEKELYQHKVQKAAASKEHMMLMKYLASLHGECDWLVKYYGARQQARSDEVDSLKKAKAVLSGADYSLLQRGARGFLGHSV